MDMKACELVDRAKTIRDPRRQCRNLKHRLEDLIVLGFCGTLAGCDDFVEIVACRPKSGLQRPSAWGLIDRSAQHVRQHTADW